MAISLKAARVNAGLTQTEMAKELGVSTVTVWKWETGQTDPRFAQLQKFCDICKVEITDIFLPKT